MFTRSELRQNLLGSLEVALFMRTGTGRFSASRESMKRSFMIPVVLLPLTVASVLAAHPEKLDIASMQALALIYTLRLFVYLAGFLALVYSMARSMDRLDSFYRFATANNWLTLPAAVIMFPVLALFLNGYYTWAEIYPLMVFMTLYSYAYTAFMTTYVLRVPFELACFVAIAGMALHQTSLEALKWVAVNALMMVS